MADTHKDLDYLRYYYASEESLLDKDLLKAKAFEKYNSNVNFLFAIPAILQIMQISKFGKQSAYKQYMFLRQLKIYSLGGSILCALYEKEKLDKKWQYYNRFYPEPTQLQRTLVQEAEIFRQREAMGLEEVPLQDKLDYGPEQERIYEQMYRLPPQRYMEPDQDVNPLVKPHWGSS